MTRAFRFLPAAACTALLGMLSLAAAAAPLFGGDDLRRHGAVSRHTWTPEFASGDVAGLRLSAGLALGLRGGIRSQLNSNVAPALVLELTPRANLSLLAADKRGAMLVWQRSN